MNIYLAEDDYEFRNLLASVLRADGHAVTECPDGSSLLDRLETAVPAREPSCDLVISDVRMPDLSALEILERLQHRERLPPWILMTAFGDRHVHGKARRLGVVATLDKPFEIDDLRGKVREVEARPRAER
jgi:DNA-binding response OmpR family regulator